MCVVLENLCYAKHCYHNYLICHNYPIKYQNFLTFSPKETNELKGKYISTDHTNKWQNFTSDACGLRSQMRSFYNQCEMPDLVYCCCFSIKPYVAELLLLSYLSVTTYSKTLISLMIWVHINVVYFSFSFKDSILWSTSLPYIDSQCCFTKITFHLIFFHKNKHFSKKYKVV